MELRKIGAIAAVLVTIPLAAVAETENPGRQALTVRTFNYFVVSAGDAAKWARWS